jgi:hypothetical protein
MIVTLNDDFSTWYGAFVGDYTLLRPDFVPSRDSGNPQSYTTIGLLRKSDRGLET